MSDACVPEEETPRLLLRPFTLDDAPFILRLLNEPTFLAGIGDKGVRTLADAERYLTDGPLASYREHGFGLKAVQLRATGEVIGMCGLLRRPTLDAPDLGYAFLPAHHGQGHAQEAAGAVLARAWTHHGLAEVMAITSPGNAASVRVLLRLGFVEEAPAPLLEGGEPVRRFRLRRP